MKTIFPAFFRVKPALILLAGILILTFLWQNGAPLKAQAREAPPPQVPAAPGAATAGPTTCIINFLYITTSMVQVQCTQPVVGTVIWSFASPVDAASSMSANRMLAILNTAYSLAKPVTIYYSTDTSTNPTGCYPSTCRILEGVILYQ